MIALHYQDADIPLGEARFDPGHWWFCTAGGVATVIALTSSRGPDTGTIAPGQVKAELRF